MERRGRRRGGKGLTAEEIKAAWDEFIYTLRDECACYGMMPSEYWQCSPHDIFGFIKVNRPPVMRGNMTKSQFDHAAESLRRFEEQDNG